jgi:hypothetical protein
VLHPELGIASIGSAGITIIDRQWNAERALAGTVARLAAIADITVRAQGARGGQGVRNTRRRIAGVDRARVSVVDGWSSAYAAGSGAVADLKPVASIAI